MQHPLEPPHPIYFQKKLVLSDDAALLLLLVAIVHVSLPRMDNAFQTLQCSQVADFPKVVNEIHEETHKKSKE